LPAGTFLRVLIAETGPVTERLRVREIDDDEGQRLVRIIRRGSDDRVRDVIRNVNADGSGLLYPKYRGGRAPKFALAHRRESKKIAKSTAAGHDLAVLNLEPAGAGGVPQPDAALAAVLSW
jgi:hypothetical protein